MEIFVLILELIGTAAFALSGAMIGLKRGMDLFGVCMLGLATACGGGVLRDLLLGQLPPVMFREPIFALAAVVASIIMFLPVVRRRLSAHEAGYERLLLLADSAGLGIFTAMGVAATVAAGYGGNVFFAVFLGTITGVGGGVLRDVLAGQPPYIFVKHIYALAAIFGALVCALTWNLLGQRWAMLLCAASVLLIRLLAAHFHWSLPKAKE